MSLAHLRVLVTVVATALATLATLVLAAPPAHAATTVLACNVTATATFDPGVLLLVGTAQDVGGSVKLGTKVSPLTPCTAPTGQPFVGGTGTIDGTGTLSCLPSPLSVLGTANGTISVSWYNGAGNVAGNSTISWSLTISGPLIVFTANITSGDMSGSTVQLPLVGSGFNGLCGILGFPLVAVSFVGAAAVLQL